jgi:hypothetical protein
MAKSPSARSGARRPVLLLAFGACAIALASGGCRQTVILDGEDQGNGAAGASAAGAGGGGFNGGTAGFNPFDGGFPFDGGLRDAREPDHPPAFCIGGQIQPLLFSLRVPDVVFSVDRSSAMQSFFGDSTRIEVAQSTVRSMIQKYQRVVRFGYQEFPSTSNSMCGSGMGCCAGDVTPPTNNALQAIDRALHRCDGNGPGCNQSQRPLANALAKCRGTFGSFNNDSGRKYLVVLMGGDPTCQGSDASVPACDDAVAETTKLSRMSIGTAFFGVGSETATSACLDDLALQGGLPVGMASPYYHLARSPSDLVVQLDTLVRTMADEACHIDIRTPPTDPDKVSVLFNEAPVDIDPVNGWTFELDSTVGITLHGAACDTLIRQAPRVAVIAGCSSPRH